MTNGAIQCVELPWHEGVLYLCTGDYLVLIVEIILIVDLEQ